MENGLQTRLREIRDKIPTMREVEDYLNSNYARTSGTLFLEGAITRLTASGHYTTS